MITKINRQDSSHQFPQLPLMIYKLEEKEYDHYFPKTFANHNLTIASKSFRGHIKLLGNGLTKLIIELGFNSLIFLPDLDIAWLFRQPDFKPANKSFQYLTENKIGKKFNGALQIDMKDLSIFIQHLTSLIRRNAVPQTIHFTNPGQNFIGLICQYGNLHIYTCDKKSDTLLKKGIGKTNLERIIDNNCYNKFSKSSSIKGRQISV